MKTKQLCCLLLFLSCVFLMSGCVISFGDATTAFRYEDADLYTQGNAELSTAIKDIQVSWVNGAVQIGYHEKNTVSFYESCDKELDAPLTLHYYLKEDILYIKFAESGVWDFRNIEKTLTILLPNAFALDNLEIESVSATVTGESVTANDVTIDTVSGNVAITSGNIHNSLEIDTVSGKINADLATQLNELSVDTVSGNITVTAKAITDFECNSTSGNIMLATQAMPTSGEVDSISATVRLLLPMNAGFTANFDTISGTFYSDFAFTRNGDTYIAGDGRSHYAFESISGNVHIELLDT